MLSALDLVNKDIKQGSDQDETTQMLISREDK
jgi:hypothetical protein